MKIKTFIECLSWYSSWTGGGTTKYDAYSEIENRINDFVEEHNLELVRVEHTEINGYRQHGPHEKNRDIYVKLVTTLYYNGELKKYYCHQCNTNEVKNKNAICTNCEIENIAKVKKQLGL